MVSYKDIFHHKMSGESKELVEGFLPAEVEENISNITRDGVLFDIDGNEVSTVYLKDYLLTCHKSPKLFSLEILTNGDQPVYSYYQMMRGCENTIFQTGYVRVADGEVVDSKVQNTIYPNKVIDKYLWKFDKNSTGGFYTCFQDFCKTMFQKHSISPSYFCCAEYCPNDTDKDFVFINDNGVIDGILTDMNQKGENYKENICLLNDIMNEKSNLPKVSSLMDGSSIFRFDGVVDSVRNIGQTDFKKYDLHY